MSRPPEVLIAAIRDFEPDDGNWLALNGLLDELTRSEAGGRGIEAMLSLLEKYPADDGTGVFWSIVHGVESLAGYEPALVESVRRTPAEFSVLMVGRMLNAGEVEVGGVRLLPLIRGVAEMPEIAPTIRRMARRFTDAHASSDSSGAG
ncbi:hypothetical protein [Singulisphaera sp. PoT]|uniref:hypothetical protein n=1 Tax=Singulisphaera sp. PoT TaxID=3411797 RepID=UPI003BF4A49C